MSVLVEVENALSVAIRNQDVLVRTTLKTLLGEAQTKALRTGNPVDDALVAKLIKDFVKANNESIALRANEKLVAENEILNQFLPKQMSEVEIRAAIESSGQTKIGGIMQYMKAHHDGTFDGKLASKLAREML